MHIFIKLNDRQNRSKDKTFWKGMAKIISNDISKILQSLVSILLSGFLEIYSCILVFFGVLQLSFFEFIIFFVSLFFGFFSMFLTCIFKVCMKLLLFVNIFIAFLFPSHKHLGENLSKNCLLHTTSPHPNLCWKHFWRSIFHKCRTH